MSQTHEVPCTLLVLLSVRPLIQCFTHSTPTCMFDQVNLMQYMKLSTSRDFRINAASLDAALQEQDDSQEVSAISCSRLFWKHLFCFKLPLTFTSPKHPTVQPLLGEISVSVSPYIPSRPQSHRMQRRHKSPNRRRKNSELLLCLIHVSRFLTDLELDQLLNSLLAVLCLNHCSE